MTDRRTEPRFQISSPARVFLIEDGVRELPGSLANVSASGLLLLVEEAISPGKLIVVEVEHHWILSQVQNSYPRGSKFAVGAKRLHALEKLDLPADATTRGSIATLLERFHPPVPSAGPEHRTNQPNEPESSAVPPSTVPVWPKLPEPSAVNFAAIPGSGS